MTDPTAVVLVDHTPPVSDLPRVMWRGSWDRFQEMKAALRRAEELHGALDALVSDCMASDFNEHWDSYRAAMAILKEGGPE